MSSLLGEMLIQSLETVEQCYLIEKTIELFVLIPSVRFKKGSEGGGEVFLVYVEHFSRKKR